MRLFLAIPLPFDLRKSIESRGKELTQEGLTPLRAENMHVTLKFLGECSESKVDEIKTKLAAISSPKFTCSLRGVGVFPNETYVRVVWVGIESEGKLEKLVENVCANLPGIGKDERFSAHMTIARVKQKPDLHSFLSKYKSVEFGSFEADRIDLIESVLGHFGSTYRTLAEFMFI